MNILLSSCQILLGQKHFFSQMKPSGPFSSASTQVSLAEPILAVTSRFLLRLLCFEEDLTEVPSCS